ncbi:MAG: phosphate/phosphite/phosphonate ABC transporter substrate-binding protein [Firmicutes bacterium]|nr:phosphate/phosphite/phosphonate ABC transporter substrate-binding protein [Bacillota bacterium]
MKKLALIIVLVVAFSLAGCAQPEEELVMGFVPMRDAESLIESVEPLAEMLSEELGVKVRPFTAVNYVSVVEGLGSGQVDFGFIPPFSYLLANSESEAQVILTALRSDGLPFYRSQILARADSDISIEDLYGLRVAFVDPASTSGYLYPAAHLINLGYDIDKDFNLVYAGGHDRGLQALLNGDVDVAAVFLDARERYKAEFPQAMDDTVQLAVTDPIPNISVTVAGGMDEEMAQRLATALLNIAEDEAGAEMLRELFDMYGFVPATDSDYDIVRQTARTLDVDLREAE